MSSGCSSNFNHSVRRIGMSTFKGFLWGGTIMIFGIISKHLPKNARGTALTFDGKPCILHSSRALQLSVLVLDSVRKDESGRGRVVFGLIEKVVFDAPETTLLSLLKSSVKSSIVVLRPLRQTGFDV